MISLCEVKERRNDANELEGDGMEGEPKKKPGPNKGLLYNR